MIEANKAVFRLLDNYASAAGEPLASATIPRWIATTPTEKKSLKDFLLSKKLKIDPGRALARFDRGPDNVFVVVGFNPAVTSTWLTHWNIDAGLYTAVVSELLPEPIASGLQIKQIVDAEDSRDSDYGGHSVTAISTLFPEMRGFEGQNLSHDENGKIIYDLLLSKTEHSTNWIDADLCRDLRQFVSLDLIGIPYMTIARSMLDYDQSSLFMSLYRCLEALYAHAGANRLRNTLGIAAPWNEVAVALEAELNWRPIEWQSLESLVRMGAKKDLNEICEAIRPAFQGVPSDDPFRAASDYLYKLRNAVVHYRPTHSLIDLAAVNWNGLCSACTQLILYIYSEIFGSL